MLNLLGVKRRKGVVWGFNQPRWLVIFHNPFQQTRARSFSADFSFRYDPATPKMQFTRNAGLPFSSLEWKVTKTKLLKGGKGEKKGLPLFTSAQTGKQGKTPWEFEFEERKRKLNWTWSKQALLCSLPADSVELFSPNVFFLSQTVSPTTPRQFRGKTQGKNSYFTGINYPRKKKAARGKEW